MADIELQHQVVREIEWEPRVAASRVGVTAHSGVITLNGEVGTYLERLAAERAVKRVQGVRAVANDLVVTPVEDGQRSELAAWAAPGVTAVEDLLAVAP